MTDASQPAPYPLLPAVLGFFLLPLGGALLEQAHAAQPLDPTALAFGLAGAALLGAFYLFLHGFLWFFTGAHILGFRLLPREAIGRTGDAFLTPGVVSLTLGLLFFAGVLLAGSPAPASMQSLGAILGIWTIVSIVVSFKRAFSPSPAKVALFVGWFSLLILVGLFVFRAIRALVSL